MEREADYLGLQYLYKSGYDPTAFVDFFEKIQSLEKKKPGSISKVFATHPMTTTASRPRRTRSRPSWRRSPSTWSTRPSSTTSRPAWP